MRKFGTPGVSSMKPEAAASAIASLTSRLTQPLIDIYTLGYDATDNSDHEGCNMLYKLKQLKAKLEEWGT